MARAKDMFIKALRSGEAAPEVWVRFPRQLGDVIFALPFLARLQEDWNAVARTHGVTLRWVAVGHSIGAAVFSEADPAFVSESVIETGGVGKPNPWMLLHRWRKRRPLAVINLSQSVRLALAAFMARVPVRAGIADNRLRILYTQAIRYRDLPVHLVQRYEPLLEMLTGDRRLQWLQMTPERFGGRAALDKLKAAGWDGRPYVTLAFGTRGWSKRWFPERFNWPELARVLLSQGLVPVLLADESEARLGPELLALCPEGTLALIGRTSIPEATNLQYHAYGNVAVDTGLAHTGAATGRPMVVVNGQSPESHCWPTGPSAVMVRGVMIDLEPGDSAGVDSQGFSSAHRLHANRVAALLHTMAAEHGQARVEPLLDRPQARWEGFRDGSAVGE
jgi:ADP-heptose:LPS heptosyltransferase